MTAEQALTSSGRRRSSLVGLAVALVIALVGVAALGAPSSTRAAVGQVWPAFALIAGLLLIGAVAAGDGLFDAAGAALARLPGQPAVLFVSLLALVAVVTTVLNLDTAVVFLTPVLVHAARRRQVPVQPFLYGTVLMSNSASLLLPGSNLTNLLVLSRDPTTGGTFALHMLPAWVAAVVVTLAVLAVRYRHDLQGGGGTPGARPTLHLGLGMVSTTVAVALVLFLGSPALPVLGVGLAAAAIRVAQGRVELATARRSLSPGLLASIFAIVVAIGTLGRLWSSPSMLVRTAGPWPTMAAGALGAVTLNNLSAAVLLAAHRIAHPRALLVGLNLGPNLAVSGSLSALLWMRVARGLGERPSWRAYTRVGVAVAVPTLVLSLVALAALGVP